MEIFDRIAGSYDSWYESKIGSFVDMVESRLAFSMFKAEKGMKILDVGCGTGNFSIKLAELGCSVTGIDISEEMIDKAVRKTSERQLDITYKKMDIYNLQFPDGEFDAVFSMAAFEFIHEPLKALDEMFRVTRKGGSIMVRTINGDSSWGRLYMTEEFQKNSVFRFACFKTLDEMKGWKADKLVDSGQSLFIPFDSAEEDITMEKEAEYSRKNNGGFICAQWIK